MAKPFNRRGVTSLIEAKGGSIFGLGIGNVYWVIQTTNGDYTRFVRDMQFTYPDGTSSVYGDVQTALDACVDERNDYVLVMPDTADYDVGATLTVSKANSHLICVAGLGAKFGAATRAATIDPNGAFDAITVTGRGCEVAGFWIRGATEKGCVTVSGLGCWIHHNDCAVTATTSLAFGVTIESAGAEGRVENNFIFSNAGSGTWLHGISLHQSATRSSASGNVIHASNGTTLTVGIDSTSVGANVNGALMTIADNYIMEAGAFGAYGASTITAGIRAADSALVVNNRIGIATAANGVIGGLADSSFISNYEGTSGGTLLT
jgi:hypothetical protein